MSMNRQRLLTIYIRPMDKNPTEKDAKDNGPIMQVRIDLMDVEMVALKNPDVSQQDELRIRELARLIKEAIKKQYEGDVYPERNRDQLAILLRGLRDSGRFNGVVLEVPGSIPYSANGKAQNTGVSGEVKKELEKINQQVESLSRALRTEKQAHEEDRAKLATVRSNYTNICASYDDMSTQFAQAQQNEQQARHEAARWRKTAERLTIDANTAQIEAGRFQTQFESERLKIQSLAETLQKKQQEWIDKEQELVDLRLKAREAESAIKNLTETLHEKEQEVDRLQRQMFNDARSSEVLAGDSGWDSHL